MPCCLLETRRVVVEGDVIWVTFDLSEARKALLTVTSAHPLWTEAENDSVHSSSLYGMQKFTIFPSYSFLSPTKFRLTPKGTNKGEKTLHSIFPSLLLWGMCKMRSSQYYMRSIPNSVCSLQADLDLTIYCILNISTVKWIQEALSSHQLGICHIVFLQAGGGKKGKISLSAFGCLHPENCEKPGVFLQRAESAAGCPPLSDLPQEQGSWHSRGAVMPLLSSLPLVLVDMFVSLLLGRGSPLKGQNKQQHHALKWQAVAGLY